MTVTIKSMHAGQGVDYLLRTVAADDGDRSLRDPLTRGSSVAFGDADASDGVVMVDGHDED